MRAAQRGARVEFRSGRRFAAAGLSMLIVAGLVSGCGSSSSTKSTSTTSTTAVQNIEADQLLGRAQLLSVAEFPSGWSEHGSISLGKSTDESSTNAFAETQSPELATCLGVNAQLSVTAAEAASPTFSSESESFFATVDDSAFVYATTAEAQADFPPFTNPKLAECVIKGHEQDISDQIASEMPSGITVGVPVASLGTFPKYGNQSGMIQIGIPLSDAHGSLGTVNMSFLIIRQGRSIAQLVLVGFPTPFTSSLAQSLAQKVTAKMAATPSSHNT